MARVVASGRLARHRAPAWRVTGALLVALAALPFLTHVAAQGVQTPIFRSNVELVVVDAQVNTRDGIPIASLTAPDFEVMIDNHQRHVASVDLVDALTNARALHAFDAEHPLVRTPGVIMEGSRVYIIAVDANSFSIGDMRPAMQAAQRFVEHLLPSDLVGVYEFPFGGYRMDLTHDHTAAGRTLLGLMGRLAPPTGHLHMGISEIVDISAGDQNVLNEVIKRECNPADPMCPVSVLPEAYALGAYYENMAQQSIYGVGRLLGSLSYIPGRKTVVYVSGGLISADRIGGRPDVTAMMRAAGEQVAGSDTNLYVLHLDDSMANMISAANENTPDPSARFRQAGRDQFAMGNGLDQFAGYANGQLLRVTAGTGDVLFDRILRETSAYYLLGIEPQPEDRNGKQHFIRVKVKVKGTTVRNRAQVVIPKGS
jgi:VWFA-related protein